MNDDVEEIVELMEEGDSDQEDLETQVQQLLDKTPEERFQDYLGKQRGWRNLTRGSKNYCFESVLVSLMNIESYAKFFITEK